jgi:hypothetical protein
VRAGFGKADNDTVPEGFMMKGDGREPEVGGVGFQVANEPGG